jgi:SAM-dependent methyltransferase
MAGSGKNGDDQAALWNGPAGQTWVEAQDTLDQMLGPLEDLLVEVAAAKPRAAVLDVGCGTGSTILAVRRRLGAESRCVGIDISQPMLDSARGRAERAAAPVSFICADVEQHAFDPASFDLIISRFGVMFFADPVRALSNLRRAARADAELCFIVWRSASDNPFMTTAEQAAAPILPRAPAPASDAPGQFAFADAHRVRGLLEASGWSDIDIRPLDVECTFPEEDLVRYLTRLGPVGRALREADEATKARVLALVRPAFDRFVHADTVRFSAACWQISARAAAVKEQSPAG